MHWSSSVKTAPGGGAIEVACLSHSKGGEDTNTQYIILGSKVYFVDLDTGAVLEEFDYPA